MYGMCLYCNLIKCQKNDCRSTVSGMLMINVCSSGSGGETTNVLVNTLPWPRVEVVTVGGTPTLVSVPSMGTAPPDAQTPSNQATLSMSFYPLCVNILNTFSV